MDKKGRFSYLLKLVENLGIKEVILPSNLEDKARVLAKLKEKVEGCRKCPLYKNNTHYVFGSGNPYAEIMLVGEAPGEEEDKRGEPFVGRAGALLTDLLTQVGLNREQDVYIANILKCRPPGNRDPEGEEIKSCTHYLEMQIKILQPIVTMALGRYAAYFLLGFEDSMNHLRGKLHETKFANKLIVTYHPAAILRNMKLLEESKKDFLLLISQL